MLKKRINKSGFEALDAAIQALYKKAEGSDNYVLDVEDDDGNELKKAKDREKQRADKAERDKQALETRLQELEDEQEQLRQQSGKGLDEAGVQKLKDKHAAELKAVKDQIAAKDATLSELLVDSTANQVAADLFIAPELHAHLVKSRLKLVEEDGKPVVKVLDEDGNVSDKKVEDLRQEFVANAKFAPIIVASKASGGGASGGSKGGGAPKKKLSEMSATEEAAFANENPDAYAQMVAEG